MQLFIQYQVEKESYQQLIDAPFKTIIKLDHLSLHIHYHEATIETNIEVSIEPDKGCVIHLEKLELQLKDILAQEDQVLANGYQSWTETKMFSIRDGMQGIGKIGKHLFNQFGDYSKYVYPTKKGIFHSWTYALINQSQQDYFLVGSLDERNAYTIIITDLYSGTLQITKEITGLYLKEALKVMDIVLLRGTEKKIVDRYWTLWDWTPNERLKQYFQAPKEGVAGWTSWYHYYTDINESIIQENLNAFHQKQLPIELFQIDDGWQHAVGDWLISNRKFPNGLSILRERIQEKGYNAGLWLAPFICQHQSILYRQHPDWIQRDEAGKMVKAAYNALWKSWMYVLDIYNLEVQDYLQKVFNQIFDKWGFDMVKLDFLYAIAYKPPVGKTSAMVMADGMELLRTWCKDKIILGCGVPLASAFNQVDFCRIGPDIHLKWEMGLLKWLGSRERVSTIMAIENTIYRHHMNLQAFHNDPDVSILRDHKNELTKDQKYTLFLVNQIFGNLQFISDNINEYDATTLELYQAQFPLREKEIIKVEQDEGLYTIQFRIGDLKYLTLVNTNETEFFITLPDTHPHYRFFQNKNFLLYNSGESFSLKAYQSICFLVVDTSLPVTLVGSSGHLFPASELDWQYIGENRLQIQYRNNTVNRSKIAILLNNDVEVIINDIKYRKGSSRIITINGQ